MTLIACGLNHKTAPIALREKLAIAHEQTPVLLKALLSNHAVNEAVLLSTCNRTELYTHHVDQAWLLQWMAEMQGISVDELKPHFYCYEQQTAVEHIMRVASGLDSMVLGEPQILGQMKKAVTVAKETGCVGQQLGRLFQQVFSATKMVRAETNIGVNAVSVAYSAVNLAKKIFSSLSDCRVLLIGAGETIALSAVHLHAQGVKRIVIANRHPEKAAELAAQVNGHCVAISDVPVYLKEVDVVMSATASQLPLLGKGAVESALKARKHKPIFMVDLAMPRDIEPEVGGLEDIYLYNIDDLKQVIDDNYASRQQAAKQGEAIISLQAAHYMRQLKSLNAVETVRDLREHFSDVNAKELQKALEKLKRGQAVDEVMTSYSHALLNKLLHHPSKQLRQAAYDGRLDMMVLVRELFNL